MRPPGGSENQTPPAGGRKIVIEKLHYRQIFANLLYRFGPDTLQTTLLSPCIIDGHAHPPERGGGVLSMPIYDTYRNAKCLKRIVIDKKKDYSFFVLPIGELDL